ncbi:MAG: hypothetical protein EXS69_01360 [Candidatus Zambryskibacteria bacterium]|nr:hypothetical protein [Candidatus Zambryskibacteria bacterium]
MKNLFSLLERFRKVLNKDTLTKEVIIKVVADKTRVKLLSEWILLRDGVLEITAGASAKNEISLREELIKSELKEAHQILISKFLYK